MVLTWEKSIFTASDHVIITKQEYVDGMEYILRDRRRFPPDTPPGNDLHIEKQISRGYENPRSKKSIKTNSMLPNLRIPQAGTLAIAYSLARQKAYAIILKDCFELSNNLDHLSGSSQKMFSVNAD